MSEKKPVPQIVVIRLVQSNNLICSSANLVDLSSAIGLTVYGAADKATSVFYPWWRVESITFIDPATGRMP